METIVQNIDKFFADISFVEDTHSYFLPKHKIKYSVSGIVKKFVPYTDWEKVLIFSAKKQNVTPEVLKAKWDDKKIKSCALGSNVHLFGEKYPFDRKLKPTNGYEKAIVRFWTDLPDYIVPIKLELMMYHKILLFAGTMDILLYNTKTKEFYICDYKTNEDLFKNYGCKKMLYPFNNMLDMAFSHYTIQLSLYQILAEQIPGIKISKRRLIWLKPTGEYFLYDTENITKQLSSQLVAMNLN